MHTIELSRSQVQKLVDHCAKHDLKTWFVGKDHGAYVGASAGSEPDQKCIYYFQGCDPSKDKDFYDTAHAKFGDDFGERMPVVDLQKALDNPQMLCVEVKVTSKSITLDVFETPANKTSNAGSAAVYYGVRKPNGKVGCVKKDGVEAVLLELCGGGQTTAQTAKAMEAGRELRETGSVTVKGYWIGPLGEV